MPKSNVFIRKTVDDENLSIAFALYTGKGENAQPIDGIQPLNVSIASFPEAIVDRLALHGLSQKIGDTRTALVGSDDAQELMTRMSSLVDRLQEGDWNLPSESRGGATSYLFRAVVELCGVTNPERSEAENKAKAEDILKMHLSADDAERKAAAASIAANPKVSDIIARLQAEAQAAKTKGVEAVEDSVFA